MSDILIHVEAGVQTLTINRVAKKNSFTPAMYAAMALALEQSSTDAAVRVTVIQGDISVFSAGNDIEDFLKRKPDGEESPAFSFLRAIAQYPKPLIAAVCGPAVGVGTTLLF
ncbi:MAG: enoyl-CoA hydratase-related protein, partial [Rhodoferax sp.]